MERIISDEEKIRKAVEISQRRNNYYGTLNRNTINIESKKEFKIFKKMFLQIIICLLIYGSYHIILNQKYIFSSNVIDKTNIVLNYDIDFNGIFEKFKNNINGFIENFHYINNLQDSQVYNTNETDEKLEISEENKKVQEDINIIENVTIKEEKEISQTEKDLNYIKENFEFIKPISGKISSKFGNREVLINGMTEDHKGIDISANQGTKIKASIEGQVEEASYNSKYGNFIKIKNNDLLTVYAHCKKIKVKKGDIVKKGDVIATVGSTGVATGPHLHFEIRLNNRYINPELIIQF